MPHTPRKNLAEPLFLFFCFNRAILMSEFKSRMLPRVELKLSTIVRMMPR